MQQPQQPEALDPKLIHLIAKGSTAFHEGVSSSLENFILGIHFAFNKLTEAKPSPVIEIGEEGQLADMLERIAIEVCPHDWENTKERMEYIEGAKNGAFRMHQILTASSRPALSPIVGERGERKYPIGGYAPGNYYCNCVTCKEKFQGDKRAVQCEPCAIKMVEDSGGKDYAHIHVSLPNGATATVSPDTSPELLNALTKMVDLAKAMSDSPTEQALPEEISKWIEGYSIEKYPTQASLSLENEQVMRRYRTRIDMIAMYHKMQPDIDDLIEHSTLFNRMYVEKVNELSAVRDEADREKEKLGWEIVALTERLSAAREQVASARTLILNIKRGNIYQEPADECDKWLRENIETK